MAREALGVGDDDPIGVGSEHPAQRVDLGRGRAAPCRCVGLVRDEHRLLGDDRSADAARLGLLHDGLHHRADVFHVEARPVERRVGGHRAEHFADRLQATLGGRRGRLDHERRCAHAHDHPVASAVEWSGGILDVFVGGGRAAREEAARDPRHQRVARGIVGRHHDHAPATAGADPVLGQRERLRGRRTGCVDLGVRARERR